MQTQKHLTITFQNTVSVFAICLECKYGVIKEHLKGHAWNRHRKIWNPVAPLWAQVVGLNDPIPVLNTLHDYLEQSQNAFQCVDCLKMFKSKETMKRHKMSNRTHQHYEKCAAVNIFRKRVLWQRVQQPIPSHSTRVTGIREILRNATSIASTAKWDNVQHCFIVVGWVEYVKQYQDAELKTFASYSSSSVLDTDSDIQNIEVNQEFIQCIRTHCKRFLNHINTSMNLDNFYTRLQIGR